MEPEPGLIGIQAQGSSRTKRIKGHGQFSRVSAPRQTLTFNVRKTASGRITQTRSRLTRDRAEESDREVSDREVSDREEDMNDYDPHTTNLEPAVDEEHPQKDPERAPRQRKSNTWAVRCHFIHYVISISR